MWPIGGFLVQFGAYRVAWSLEVEKAMVYASDLVASSLPVSGSTARPGKMLFSPVKSGQ
jgi:hypothetical protein